jgi:hypothetical protein
LRQRYLTDNYQKYYISLPINSIIICDHDITSSEQYITKFPYPSDNGLQNYIKNNIMHMIFVDINRVLEKKLAEMSDFDQLMCFFNVKSKEGLRFLYENGGAVFKRGHKIL